MASSEISGQNAEEAAELLATMRAEHVKMKSWYNNVSDPDHVVGLSGLKAKYGESFPAFWQDLPKWDGWKEVRREYLLYSENGCRFVAKTNGDGDGAGRDQQTRRRRKRWGDAAGGDDDAGGERSRRSRWASESDAPAAPPPPVADPVMAALGLSAPIPSGGDVGGVVVGGIGGAGIASGLDPRASEELAALQARLRVANARLSNLDYEASRIDALPRGHPERSPSPPPLYGPDGTRKNTRVNRWREKYGEERTVCLESIMDLIPSMRPPGFISKRKRSRRIHIPVEEFPTYNFIGLIIGPRGKTQKDMENKTGCKIAIRGKGSVKEGAKGRRNGVAMEGDDEPLHVLITGDDPAAIDAAAEMVESMLVVIDDEKNVHKQNQLRELALLNGTLKDEDWCHVCGEKGHKDFECPKRFALGNRSRVVVKCAICGDASHPTRDCVMRPQEGGSEDAAKAKLELDSDYSAFMAELDGKPPPSKEGGGDVCPRVPSDPSSTGGGSSFLTVIQPLRIVGENGGGEIESSAVAPAIATTTNAIPASGDIWSSYVTTISSNVTTIGSSRPVAPLSVDASEADSNPHATTNVGVIDVSTVAESAADSTVAGGASLLPPAPATTASIMPMPPPPAGFPPPPIPLGLPPPPPVLTMMPPPPMPPPMMQAYPGQQQYSAYQHHQPMMGWHMQPPPPPSFGGQPPPPAYGAPPQHQQQPWNAASGGATGETAGWDPSSFYGSGYGGDATGAGGFNWWESSADE
jgi:splicing factor 1